MKNLKPTLLIAAIIAAMAVSVFINIAGENWRRDRAVKAAIAQVTPTPAPTPSNLRPAVEIVYGAQGESHIYSIAPDGALVLGFAPDLLIEDMPTTGAENIKAVRVRWKGGK